MRRVATHVWVWRRGGVTESLETEIDGDQVAHAPSRVGRATQYSPQCTTWYPNRRILEENPRTNQAKTLMVDWGYCSFLMHQVE